MLLINIFEGMTISSDFASKKTSSILYKWSDVNIMQSHIYTVYVSDNYI